MLEPDYFARKRAELGFDRLDELGVVQAWCDEHYPGTIRVKRLHQGVLQMVTTSASVAGDLRLRQIEIMALLTQPPKRLSISIGSLS